MLNYLWSFMILTGIVYAAFTGRMPDITNAALDSSKEAISLCITMIGVMSFLGRTDGNCFQSRNYPGRFQKDPAGHSFPFSKSSRRSPRRRTDYHQYDRQYLRSWLGRHSCRIKSNGRIIEIRRTAPQTSGSRYLPPCRNSK